MLVDTSPLSVLLLEGVLELLLVNSSLLEVLTEEKLWLDILLSELVLEDGVDSELEDNELGNPELELDCVLELDSELDSESELLLDDMDAVLDVLLELKELEEELELDSDPIGYPLDDGGKEELFVYPSSSGPDMTISGKFSRIFKGLLSGMID